MLKLSAVYEQNQKFLKAVKVLVDGQLFEEAASKAKTYENMGITLSDEFSSTAIAKKQLLAYGKVDSTSEIALKKFRGLLMYIGGEEERMVFLKHAKLFGEVLNKYLEMKHYRKFYRLIFAQVPLRISKLYTYECMLRMSLKYGHKDLWKHLVIHSARAFLHPKKLCKIFPSVELQELSSDSNVEIKLNSLLLMARYSATNRAAAVDACNFCKYLPGEVELKITTLQQDQQDQSSFRICDELDLTKKIICLLSLKPFELLEMYRSILGLYRGSVDDMYEKQYQGTDSNQDFSDLSDGDYYLLPHVSQDIWIGTLCQGKAITDIDGMHIIQKDALHEKISVHLKENLRPLIQRAFEHVVSESPLWSCIKSDVPVINNMSKNSYQITRTFLELCKALLVSTSFVPTKSPRDKSWKRTVSNAIQVLQQFNSINVSLYFPICENYTACMDTIRGDAWHYFQMRVKRSIESVICSKSSFDFLKVWELSSIAKITADSRKNLHSLPDSPQKKIALDWFCVSENVIDFPADSCTEFVHGLHRYCTAILDQDSNLTSVVNAVSVYGTIILALLSSSNEVLFSPVIPFAYYRALLVYDGYLSKRRTILRACCDQTHNQRMAKQVSRGMYTLLNNLLDSLISSCKQLFNGGACKDLPRLSLILMLILLINCKMLKPDSQGINSHYGRFHDELVKINIHKGNASFNFSLEQVCDAMKGASTTGDLVQIVEYLLCPNTTEHRFEPLAIIKTITERHRRMEVLILNEEDVAALPKFSLLESKVHLSQYQQCCITVVPLSHEQQHSFKLPLPEKEQQTSKLSTFKQTPPWMLVSDSVSTLPLVLSSQTLEQLLESDKSDSGLCQVCQLAQSEDHKSSPEHKSALEMYKKFLKLEDMEYTYYTGQLQLKMKSRGVLPTLKEATKRLLDDHQNDISLIYKNCDWMRGVDLLQTKCIPELKELIKGASHI